MMLTVVITQRSLFGPWPWRDLLFACGCSLVLFGVSPAILLLLLLLFTASLESDAALQAVYKRMLQLYEVGTLVISAFAFGVGVAVLYLANHQHDQYHRDRLSSLLWQDVRVTKVALRAIGVACTGQLIRQQALRSACHHDEAVELKPLPIDECLVFRPSDALLMALSVAASLSLLSLARCVKPPLQTALLPTTTRHQPRVFTLASAA